MQRVSTTTRLSAALAAGLALGLTSTARADTVTYTYDSVGRVIAVTHSDGTQTTYSYDAAGNRTQQIAVTRPVVVSFAQRVAPSAVNDLLNIKVTSGIPFTLAYTGGPSAGSISITGTSMTYSAPASAGTYTFLYTATNSIGTSSPAGVVTLNVDPTAHLWNHFQWGAVTW